MFWIWVAGCAANLYFFTRLLQRPWVYKTNDETAILVAFGAILSSWLLPIYLFFSKVNEFDRESV